MAKRKHLTLLKQGVKIWNQWREENPDVVPELKGANLEDANLENVNLIDADLEGASLVGANLEGSTLLGASLVDTDLSAANFSRAELMAADLDNAILLGTTLISANLTDANLHNTICAGAHFMNADLTRTDLSGADLRHALLSGANLDETNLDFANLTKSVLIQTHFYQTELNATVMYESKMSHTFFSKVDISSVRGLESVIHDGPSTIGIDTLFISKGKIPESFLRGCGVSDDLITYLPSLLARPIEFYSCFISYAHADKAFARQLHDFLQGRGIRCWLDEHQLLPGHDIFEEIDRGINLWDKVLLCASKDSLTSWWVDNEIDRAFKKEQTIMKSRGKKVLALIPLDLDGFIFDGWENGKAPQVKSRLTADFTGWETDNDKLQKQFELVVKALRTDGGREAPPPSKL